MSTSGPPTTVVIVEDEPLLRAGLRELLRAEPNLTVTGEAPDGPTAVAVITATKPDVALVDIQLPILDGIEVTRQVTGSPGSPRVLLLTTFASEEYMMAGLGAGASGFLLKTASPEQVIEAIQAIASGQAVVAPTMTRTLIDRAVQSQDQARREHFGAPLVRDPPAQVGPVSEPGPRARSVRALPALSARETDVLRLVAQGRSDKAIARSLGIAVPTVKSHVHRVLTKLDVTSRLQAALVARDAGLAGQP